MSYLEDPYPMIFLGDFVAARIVLLAGVPQTASSGAQVRALRILNGESLSPDTGSYWTLEIGKIRYGVFERLAKSVAFTGGWTGNVVQTIGYQDPVLLSRGDDLAARMLPSGTPPPLVGVSIGVEWGSLSTRRNARG